MRVIKIYAAKKPHIILPNDLTVIVEQKKFDFPIFRAFCGSLVLNYDQ
jgi:hypothetical protein